MVSAHSLVILFSLSGLLILVGLLLYLSLISFSSFFLPLYLSLVLPSSYICICVLKEGATPLAISFSLLKCEGDFIGSSVFNHSAGVLVMLIRIV